MRNVHQYSPFSMQSAGNLPVWYGIIHALVDCTTVTAIFRAAHDTGLMEPFTPFLIVLGYDLLAFALQAPLGVIADRFGLYRKMLVLGLFLSLGAVISIPSGWITMLLAGLGNALFHLAAGAKVLDMSGGKAGPAGIFVAPGALGLGLGTWLGKYSIGPVWPLAIIILVCLMLVWYIQGHQIDGDRPIPVPRAGCRKNTLLILILGLLLISVAIRSYVGLGGTWQCPGVEVLMITLPLAAFLGKLLGGIIADRVGWIETSVMVLLVSAPLIALNGGSPGLVTLGLLLFQSTMPVTLAATYLLMPERPATAFGLPCLALVTGAVLTFFPLGKSFYGSGTFLLLITGSAMVLLIGLYLLGIQRRYRPAYQTGDE